MEDVEARFAHLLQPIRDLTKNWEVDVAAQLGEYLEELDQICISFDEGKTTMNFIEAALLIQGSACVYSKKVEYLYSLVYQALDFISGKRRARQPSSGQDDGASGDASSRQPQEADDKFMSLDDLPDSRANVDLKNNQAPTEVLIVPLLPMALVAPDEMEKAHHPLYSRQGEILASRKDFRMNTCTPHLRGAFMLEPVGVSSMEPGGSHKEASMTEEQLMEVPECRSPVPVLSLAQGPGSPEGPEPGGGGDDDDVEEALQPPKAATPEAAAPEAAQEPGSPESPTLPRRYLLRERVQTAELLSQPEENPDPWQSLDPFDSLDSQPFKKGRPYSVPPCVEEAPGQKRKRKCTAKLQDFHQWYLAAYAEHNTSGRPRRKGPSFADMEVLYWQHVREQLETLRKLKRREMAKQWLPEAEEEEVWPAEEERLEGSLEDLGAADDLEAEGCVQPEDTRPAEASGLEAEVLPTSLSYEELVRKNVELFIASSQKFVQETELSQRVRAWEDTVQPLLQEQEQHVPFDIHTYGDQVVSQFPQLNQWCRFAELVAGQPAFEVCRAMLASLQLANDYTVEITQQPGLAVDTMSLRLLTHQRAHKRFQTYTAPSMAQP